MKMEVTHMTDYVESKHAAIIIARRLLKDEILALYKIALEAYKLSNDISEFGHILATDDLDSAIEDLFGHDWTKTRVLIDDRMRAL
jgi:hypothetical protein